MRLCQFDIGKIGVVDGDMVRDVTAIVQRLPLQTYPLRPGDPFIAALSRLREEIESLAARASPMPLASVQLRSPVANPGKLVAAPVNYAKHLQEAIDDPATFSRAHARAIHETGLFLKAPSSMIGPAEQIMIQWPDRRTDHEVELAVVIGRHCRNVGRDEALSYVAGYTVGLDITLRGPEERSFRKSIDSYSVLGPWLVTADEIGDPGALSLFLDVNGERRQSADTRDLVIDVPGLIELASSWYSLEPGDVIYTGTPEGVGQIVGGDVIHAGIDRIGSLDIQVKTP